MPRLIDPILREIGALARSIHSINDIQFRLLHLQKGQFIFLTRTCENPGINLSDLAQLLRVDKTTATKATQKLIRDGYIRKEKDPADGRICRLYPTEKASNAYQHVISEENRCIQKCFQSFNPHEKETALQLVTRMRQNIDQDWKMVKTKRPVKELR